MDGRMCENVLDTPLRPPAAGVCFMASRTSYLDTMSSSLPMPHLTPMNRAGGVEGSMLNGKL